MQTAVSDWSDRPIYVGGNPKSGKTLFACLLDSHPEILCLPKEIPFKPPGVLLKPGDRSVRNEREMLDLLAAYVGRRYLDLNILNQERRSEAIAAFQRRLGQESVTDLHSVYAALASSIRDAYGLHDRIFSAWSFENCAKRTYHTFLESYPLGKVVHIRRDPRSWILSRVETLLRKKGRVRRASLSSPLYLYRTIRDWLSFERYADSVRARYGTARVHVVSFEQLVTDPASTMNGTWDFLELPAPPWLFPSILKRALKTDGEPVDEIYRRVALDWRDRLPTAARLWIEVTTRRYLTSFPRQSSGT